MSCQQLLGSKMYVNPRNDFVVVDDTMTPVRSMEVWFIESVAPARKQLQWLMPSERAAPDDEQGIAVRCQKQGRRPRQICHSTINPNSSPLPSFSPFATSPPRFQPPSSAPPLPPTPPRAAPPAMCACTCACRFDSIDSLNTHDAAQDAISTAVAHASGQEYCECVCPANALWRCDCSGLVSRAWGLGAPGLTTYALLWHLRALLLCCGALTHSCCSYDFNPTCAPSSAAAASCSLRTLFSGPAIRPP
jgi:hypothetical protein